MALSQPYQRELLSPSPEPEDDEDPAASEEFQQHTPSELEISEIDSPSQESESPKLSKWAQKYGEIESFFGHSQYTPITPRFPRGWTINKDEAIKELWQRRMLNNFTTRELMDLDVFSERELREESLQEVVLPWLRSGGTWDDNQHDLIAPELEDPLGLPPEDEDGDVTMEDGDDGEQREFWIASNPKVKRILTPVLALASKMLTNLVEGPLFEALFFAPRQVVPSNLLSLSDQAKLRIKGPGDQKLYSFWPLKPDNAVNSRAREKKKNEVYDLLKQRLRLCFCDGIHEFRTQVPDGEDIDISEFSGLTYAEKEESEEYDLGVDNGPNKGIVMVLNCKPFIPLLRDDLTDSERYGITYHNATTVMHESWHAFRMVADMIDTKDRWNKMYTREWEPYFQDEPVSELGFAMEFAGHGGAVFELMADKLLRGLPTFAFSRESVWPTTYQVNGQRWVDEDVPQLLHPQMKTTQRHHPLPVTLFEDALSEDFWEYVRVFRIPPAEMRPTPVYTEFRHIGAGDEPVFSGLIDVAESKLQKIVSQMQLRPSTKKTVLGVGEEILESAKLGERYWTKSRRQEKAVAKFLQLPPDQHNVHSAILDHLRSILKSHAETVAAHLALLDNSNATRQHNLLIFNRGTRVFIQRLIQKSTGLSSKDFEHINMRFEIQHLILSSKQMRTLFGSPAGERRDNNRLKRLEKACDRGNNDYTPEDVDAGYKEIMRTAGISFRNRTLATIIYCGWKWCLLSHEVRVAEVTKTWNKVKAMRKEEGLPKVVETELDHWRKDAHDILKGLNGEKRTSKT